MRSVAFGGGVGGAVFYFLSEANRVIDFTGESTSGDPYVSDHPDEPFDPLCHPGVWMPGTMTRKRDYTPLGWRFYKLTWICFAVAVPFFALFLWLGHGKL